MIRMIATIVTATATTTDVTTELEPVPAERPDFDEFLLSALGTTVLNWVATKTKIDNSYGQDRLSLLNHNARKAI